MYDNSPLSFKQAYISFVINQEVQYGLYLGLQIMI